MGVHVAIAPDLSLSPEDFVAAWNGAPESAGLAEAKLVRQPPQGFPLDPQLAQSGLVLLSTAAGAVGGLVLEALKNAVKERLTEFFKDRLTPKPKFEVTAVRQPDGAYLLVVAEPGQ